nr:RNA polymerase sigma factor SigF [Streptomyces sp. ISL-11]
MSARTVPEATPETADGTVPRSATPAAATTARRAAPAGASAEPAATAEVRAADAPTTPSPAPPEAPSAEPPATAPGDTGANTAEAAPEAAPPAARAAEPPDPSDTADGHPRSRGADARALTQVLFKEFVTLEPGTPEHTRVRAALIEANLPLVRYAAARFRSRNEPMEDVVQVGTIGLINAIDRFDPDRGVQFPTFAMPTVVGEIKRYFRDNVRTVHVPRRLHELWVQVNGASEDLTVLHGRTPTTSEIAERLRIPEEEVLACIEAGRSYHATSLEAAQEGDGLPGLLDRLGYEDPALAGVEHRDLVRHLLVQLPEREQRILLLRYYSNLTQSQISAELGVSQMHVSRLLSRSFARLRSANRIDA